MMTPIEIDRLVAEKFFGLAVIPDPANVRGWSVGSTGSDGQDLPLYAEASGHMVVMLDHLAARHGEVELASSNCGWVCRIGIMPTGPGWKPKFSAWATKASMAVALAALQTVGIKP